MVLVYDVKKKATISTSYRCEGNITRMMKRSRMRRRKGSGLTKGDCLGEDP